MDTRDEPTPVDLPLEREGTSRRTFLRRAGYGVAAAALTACTRAPVRHVVPRLDGTEGAAPGRPVWIATTCGGCPAGCGVLARVVDGRPVKLEGIDGHPISDGALCAVGQAQTLSLYDGRRLASPSIGGAEVSWDAFDADVRRRLSGARDRAVLLTGTVSSPSTIAWIGSFCREFGARHVVFDALSMSAVAAAHRVTHGVRVVPRYRFGRASVVAAFGADPLGTWLSPVEFAAGRRAARSPDAHPPTLQRLWVFEARTSLTGLRADRRFRLAPWETGTALAELHDALAAADGDRSRISVSSPRASIAELAALLRSARGESLVVCDDGDPGVQAVVNAVNVRIGAYERVIDVDAPSRARLGDDAALRALVASMRSGAVGAVVVAGCNPVHSLPADCGIAEGLALVPNVVAIAPYADETTAIAHAVAPELHALESWNDAEPAAGVFCLTQPTVPPLRDARTLRACLARWCGDAGDDGERVRAHWRSSVLPRIGAEGDLDLAIDRALHDGFVLAPERTPEVRPVFRPAAVSAPAPRVAPAYGAFAALVYAKVGMLDGVGAQNAWLHELPDPVSKVVWDNYACLSPDAARRVGVATGDVVRIEGGAGPALELPALVQPGQHDGVVAVALGYGRAGTDRFTSIGPTWIEGEPTVAPGGTVGRNAAGLRVLDEQGLRDGVRTVRVVRTGARRELACTQDHHTLSVPAHLAPRGGEVRDAVRTVAAADVEAGRASVRPVGQNPGHGAGGGGAGDVNGEVSGGPAAAADLWPDDHPKPGPRWGMVIDLAACDGCSACVVACQAENNIPVVGRDEVRRHREMHWLRIDRYYDGGDDALTASQQPMTCQHCANAPCETVCPVLATVHSSEGLNQQVYNRCVGTRYCANNCPYKVRRFNWFDYPRPEPPGDLGLNPNVTVRMRGVMEKCSLCVQRIQEAKSDARRRRARYADGDARTACQQTCPAGAIVFGDLADPESAVASRLATPRGYQVLAELNVRPAVTYLADVRDRPAGAKEEGHDDGH